MERRDASLKPQLGSNQAPDSQRCGPESMKHRVSKHQPSTDKSFVALLIPNRMGSLQHRTGAFIILWNTELASALALPIP